MQCNQGPASCAHAQPLNLAGIPCQQPGPIRDVRLSSKAAQQAFIEKIDQRSRPPPSIRGTSRIYGLRGGCSDRLWHRGEHVVAPAHIQMDGVLAPPEEEEERHAPPHDAHRSTRGGNPAEVGRRPQESDEVEAGDVGHVAGPDVDAVLRTVENWRQLEMDGLRDLREDWQCSCRTKRWLWREA